MPTEFEILNELLSENNEQGVEQFVNAFRPRLKRMVSARLDSRMSSRVDPSDIVQDALFEAVRKMPECLKDRPLPIYPWLRQLALGQMGNQVRTHLGTQSRSVMREQPVGLSDQSVMQLASVAIADESTPSRFVMREEARDAVNDALSRLDHTDREVLILKFVEQATTNEIAEILNISPEAVGMRRLRALRRLSQELDGLNDELT